MGTRHANLRTSVTSWLKREEKYLLMRLKYMLQYFAEAGFTDNHDKCNLITYYCKNRPILKFMKHKSIKAKSILFASQKPTIKRVIPI